MSEPRQPHHFATVRFHCSVHFGRLVFSTLTEYIFFTSAGHSSIISFPSSSGHRRFDTGTFRARRLDLAWWSAIHLAEIDETIPVLLEAMVLGEMADIGPTRWPFSRRVANISRHRRSGKEVCRWPTQRTKRCREFYASLEATHVDPASSGLQNDPLDDTAVAPPG
jgi:hypothetical protein